MPFTASALKKASPVQKYIVLVLVGSWQIPVTARLLKKSFTKFQAGRLAVISFVFHTPPFTPPIQTVLPVASALSTHIALTRPEVTPLPGLVLPLPGPTASLFEPLSIQVSGVSAFVEGVLVEGALANLRFIDSVSNTAAHILSLGTLPVAGSFVLFNSNSAALSGLSYPSFSSLFSFFWKLASVLWEQLCSKNKERVRASKNLM